MDGGLLKGMLISIIVALGISMTPAELATGTVFGLAGAFIFRGFLGRENMLEAWMVPFVSVIASLGGAVLHDWRFPDTPPAGFVAFSGIITVVLYKKGPDVWKWANAFVTKKTGGTK